MKNQVFFAFIALLLSAAVAQATAPTEWSEEIPGIPDSVTELQLEGDNNKQGLAYSLTNANTVGFSLRTGANAWSIQTSDITGNSTDLTKLDSCYLGGTSWSILGLHAANSTAWFYTSTDDGETWTLGRVFTSVGNGVAMACNGSTKIGVAHYDLGSGSSKFVVFWRSTDAGASFTGGYVISDDDGNPNNSGSSVFGTPKGFDITWVNGQTVVLALSIDSGGGVYKAAIASSDDGGSFWTIPVSVISESAVSLLIGVDNGGSTYYGAIDYGSPVGTWGFTGLVDDDEIGTSNFGCGNNRCQISANSEGQTIVYGGNGDRVWFRDGPNLPWEPNEVIPGTVSAVRSMLLTDTTAYVAYIDVSQGSRVEFMYSAVPDAPTTYTNPNGYNWGEVLANYSPTTPQVYLKERVASNNEALGHVYRVSDELTLISHFNACPSTTYSGGVGGTTKSESLSTPGTMAIYPDASSPTIVSTACLNDYTTTREHYVINSFTGSGSFTGGMPYADVDFIDNPAHIDVCLNGGVGIQSFAQVDYINFTVANVFGAQTEYLTFDVSRGHEKSFIVPDLAITTVDPLSQETCSLYYVSTTDGFGKVSHIRDGATTSQWANAASGNGIAAYGGRVWVTNTAGTMITEYEDLGNSFSTIDTTPLTTTINAFNERLRVSHDGAYLIAHCGTDDICVIDSTSYVTVYSVTIPAGGTVSYDLDHYNRYLYIARDDVAYAYEISAFTGAFGDPGNCVGPTPPAACTPTTTTTSTTSGIGPGGVGGNEGGFIDEPGSGIPGLDIEGTASSIGMSTAALAWLLGILWVSIFTVAFGTLPMLGSGGKFSVALAAVGYIVGLGGATAFSLLPVWFILVNGVLGAGFLVMNLRSA